MSDTNEKITAALGNASPFDSSSNKHKLASLGKLPIRKNPDDEEGKGTGNEHMSDTHHQSE